MNATRTLALASIIALALAPAAWADWTPDKPAKWVQFPDLGDTGLDVRCGPNFLGLLAERRPAVGHRPRGRGLPPEPPQGHPCGDQPDGLLHPRPQSDLG